MFENTNRVRFTQPVDDVGRAWWVEAFHRPFGLTPEGMGDLITRSAGDAKTMLYRSIDGRNHSFALRVEGRLADAGDVWFVERSLELEGSVFNADAMFIPDGEAGAGRGRRLMGDLIAATTLLGLSRISIEAERIGRYAWLRAGFVPDRASWRNIQIEAVRFVQRHAAALGGTADDIARAVSLGDPTTARWLATLEDPVPSRDLHDAEGHPATVPFGKALFLEASPNWTGAFHPDPESRAIAENYIGRHLPGEEKDHA